MLTAARLRELRSHLHGGGVIAYPTESCYGLGCDPRNRKAVQRLLRIKGRPQTKGLILIGATFNQLHPYVLPLGTEQWSRVAPTWPGPVTWLLPARERTPRWLRGAHSTLAVRVTAHPLARRLCCALGMALVSTSANRAGLKPMRSYRACRRAFSDGVLVVPGRIGARKRPSTIRDLISGQTIRK